ncbi:hypothetical protein F4677DRAFT_436566 [Hypoxylon crocopeplum]|nr:hypothetical protein F4677DRAFT_436566 [Hypoxylon crocopeplum]
MCSSMLEIVYGPTTFSAKYAVLRQIEAIFFHHPRDSLGFKFIRALIWANLIFYFAIMLAFIFNCMPQEKIWHPNTDGRCINSNASIIATSAINVVSDLTILALPLASRFQLHMAPKTKIWTAAVFAVCNVHTFSLYRPHFITVQFHQATCLYSEQCNYC